MTKKDYNLTVENIGIALNQTVSDPYNGVSLDSARATLIQFARAFAYSAHKDNPRFNAARFYEAVAKVLGVPAEQVGR